MNDEDEFTNFWGEPISVYTSESAEVDGILIKTDNKIINFITATVYSKCIEPFIEPLVMTKRSLSNKPISETIEVGKKSFVVTLKITDAEKKKAEKELLDKLIASAILEVQKLNRNDWLYTLDDCRGWKDLWVVQNETGLYTLMFNSDY